MKQVDKGILLYKTDFSESSWILGIYTIEKGKKSFIFKGGKKKVKGLFPLGIYDFTYYQRPESDLGLMESMQVAKPLLNLLNDPQRILIGFFVTDLLRQTLKTEYPDERLFIFLEEQLELLNETDEIYHFPLTFVAGLIHQLGYAPYSESDTPNFFDVQKGILVHFPAISHSVEKFGTVQLIYELFEKEVEWKNFTKTVIRQTLQELLLHIKVHLPDVDVDKTLEIIKEVLYD